jgi:hypothetical protein
MKIAKPKIIVIQHFKGTVKQTEMFKKIFLAQAEKKLKSNGRKSDTQ